MKYKGESAGVRLHQAFEAVLLLVVIFGALSWINANPRPVSFEQLLQMNLQLGHVLIAVISASIWHWFLKAVGGYKTVQYRSIPRTAATVIIAGALSAASLLLFLAIADPPLAHYKWISTVFGITVITCLLVRVTAALTSGAAPLSEKRVLIAGTGPAARRLLDHFRNEPIEAGVIHTVVGCVGSVGGDLTEHGCRLLGRATELEAILMSEVIDAVYIGLSARESFKEIEETLATCERMGIECRFPPDVFCDATKMAIEWHGTKPFVARRAVNIEAHQLLLKRIVDVVISAAAIAGLLPVMAAIALAIRLSGKGPVLFVQERFGLHKRVFRMLKFRTMVVDAESLQDALEKNNEASGPVFKMKQDPRVTPLGRFLRKTSLDELPQLFNVLLGDMSLVGPRPLPRRDVSRFEDSWLMRRFSVKPGLTCLWQVNGRSNTSFDHWIAQDLEYIDRWSLRLDLEILVRTVPAVVRGSGAM